MVVALLVLILLALVFPKMTRFIGSLALMVLFAVVMHIGAAKAEGPPVATDYPVKSIYAGPVSSPVLDTKDLKSFRTRIRQIASMKPNFAGEFAVDFWGCGTNCAHGAAVNLRTGKTFFVPGVYTYGVELGDGDAFEFDVKSRLFVIKGRLTEEGEANRYSYVIRPNGFLLVHTAPLSHTPSSPSQTSTCEGCGVSTGYFANAVSFWERNGTPSRNKFCRENNSNLPSLADCMSVGHRVFDIPKFNVDQICTDRSQNSGAVRNQCIQAEQDAYDIIKVMWVDMSLEAEARCTMIASQQSSLQYVYLRSCLQTDYEITQNLKLMTEQKSFKP